MFTNVHPRQRITSHRDENADVTTIMFDPTWLWQGNPATGTFKSILKGYASEGVYHCIQYLYPEHKP